MTSDKGDAAVILKKMAEDRFPAYRAHNLKHYAQGKVQSGVWSPEEAPRRAAAEMDELLPDGTNTRNHFLYSIRDESLPEEVGTLWFAIRETGAGRVVWVYDIEIFDRFRRKGYAKRALEAAERRAKELEATRIELHVFGHNSAARTLYERMGYAPTSIVMSRQLD